MDEYDEEVRSSAEEMALRWMGMKKKRRKKKSCRQDKREEKSRYTLAPAVAGRDLPAGRARPGTCLQTRKKKAMDGKFSLTALDKLASSDLALHTFLRVCEVSISFSRPPPPVGMEFCSVSA